MKNYQIYCCIDFHDLKKAYRKDEFFLPNIDMLVDVIAADLIFSFRKDSRLQLYYDESL